MNRKPGQVRTPEKQKIEGVFYAVTDDGIELPVVDVTHPSFAMDVTTEQLPRIEEASINGIRSATRLPKFLGRVMALWSPIMRGTLRATGGVLDGMTTYLYKLGPHNLGRAYSGTLDRKLNAQIGPVAARLRFHSVVRLCADALSASAEAPGARILRILNLGGGSGIDTINVLLVLQRERPGIFEDRRVFVDILDPDPAGPAFGARAIETLTAPGSPLAGIEVSWRWHDYDWLRPGTLRDLVEPAQWQQVALCCSEGALLEYAPDDVVVSNLQMLHELLPCRCPVIASAIRRAPVPALWVEVSGMPFQLRTLAELSALLWRAGWTVSRTVEDNPVYHIVESRPRSGREE